MNNIIASVVFLLTLLCCSFAQILLKKSALEEKKGLKTFLNFKVIISYVIIMGVIPINSILFRYISLKQIVVLDSVSYVFIVVLSTIFLKEQMSRKMLLGVFCIILGIGVCIIG